jgi:hypothetical protein
MGTARRLADLAAASAFARPARLRSAASSSRAAIRASARAISITCFLAAAMAAACFSAVSCVTLSAASGNEASSHPERTASFVVSVRAIGPPHANWWHEARAQAQAEGSSLEDIGLFSLARPRWGSMVRGAVAKKPGGRHLSVIRSSSSCGRKMRRGTLWDWARSYRPSRGNAGFLRIRNWVDDLPSSKAAAVCSQRPICS